jgi:mannose-6-phosphate isomerase
MNPIVLGANQLHRFYRGGARIAAFRGLPTVDDAAPEDWVASTTPVHGNGDTGLSRLPDGTFLVDRIRAEPEAYLGRPHTRRFGGDPALLVKLLDAGERLPLHLHPDAAFAQRHLRSRYGKTEAWIILEAVPGASVHVGFARDVARDELMRLVRGQRFDALLAAMNRVPVAPGDSIYVPAGTPHVIGEGVLLLELQEPSDLSLLLEYGQAGESGAFLGLPPEVALAAVSSSRLGADSFAHLRRNRGASFFPPEADAFFRADRLVDGSTVAPSFAVVVGIDGVGALEPTEGDAVPIARGITVLVPFAAGTFRLTGSCRAICCRPPV